MTPDERAIRQTHSTWITAVNAGDLATLLALMTDDAVLLNPGRAPTGRQGFSADFPNAHKRNQIQCVSDLAEVVVSGDVAYTRSQDSLSVIPRDGGESAQLAGDRLTVYRRALDGRWLLARDAHTLTVMEKASS